MLYDPIRLTIDERKIQEVFVRACSFPLFFATLLVVNALGLHHAANGQPALPTFPGMEPYNPSRICGKQGVRWNPKELPPIGCFGLSGSESVSGMIADHELVVAVDSKGEAVCKVDMITVVRSVGYKSNVPNVLGTCEHLTFCFDEDGRDCSASLTEISRNSDKSIFFFIARRVFGRTFVTNQENWEYYERSKSK
jgi:hypothetical protein